MISVLIKVETRGVFQWVLQELSI